MRRFLRPMLDIVYKAVIQFFMFWRDAPWATKLVSLPVLVLCLLFLGLYTFLFGCKV